MEKYLWKFHWNCRRAGKLDSIFIATQEEVDNLIGKEIWFGEVLGKHSEVYGTVEKGEIVKLDVSQNTVDELYALMGDTLSGYNPVEYYEEYNYEEEL